MNPKLNKKYYLNWKDWYYWFSLSSNGALILLMAILMILYRQLDVSFLNTTLYPTWISLSSIIPVGLLLVYIIVGVKDFKIKKHFVEIKRHNKLEIGIAFMIINIALYYLSGFISYHFLLSEFYTNANPNLYSVSLDKLSNLNIIEFLGIMFSIMILFGTFASIFITYFHYAVAFDIFYKRYAKEIISEKENLKKFAKKANVKIENNEIDWEKILKNCSSAIIKVGENKWSQFQKPKNIKTKSEKEKDKN